MKKTIVMPRHPFHIVNKSPWPLLLSFSLYSFVISTVCLLHNFVGGSIYTFGFNFFLVVFIMGLWWRDVIREGFFEGRHTKAVMYGLRLGMVLFIVSEVMFFVAFFWAFFHSSLSPVVQIGSVWPPVDYPIIDPFAIPFLNTVILVFSGLTLTLAHLTFLIQDQTQNNKNLAQLKILPIKGFSYHPIITTYFFFGLTIILAILFTLLQLTEYRLAEYSISDGIYGSVFYMATGFHGFHVIVGTIFLIVALIRCVLGQFSSNHHIGFEAAAWYWHFVDVVWLFLFISVYWWGNYTLAESISIEILDENFNEEKFFVYEEQSFPILNRFQNVSPISVEDDHVLSRCFELVVINIKKIYYS